MDFGIPLLLLLLLRPYDVAIGSKEDCQVLSSGRPETFIFVKIWEVRTGKVVFQSTLNGGQTSGVFVRNKRIKVEHKLAGDKYYHSPILADCEAGKRIVISPREVQERPFGKM